MSAPDTYTRKVQGTILTLTRGMDDPLTVGAIQNFNGLSAPVNDIAIGSFEDTEIITRPGRKKLGTCTFDIFFNPDEEVQQTLRELQGTSEEVEWSLVYPEGTIKTRTFDALVSLFGDDSKDDNVYMGHITLVVTTDAVRT